MENSDKPQSLFSANYAYFGLYCICLILFSSSSILLKMSFTESRFFFFLYATGQAVAETALLIFLANKALASKRSYLFSWIIALTFVLWIFHFLDYFFERILDLSFFQTAGFIFDETWESFLYLLDASGVPVWAWFLGFFLSSFLPLGGLALYRLLNRICRKRPLFLRQEWLLQTFTCIPLGLLVWEHTALTTILPPNTYVAFVKALPWKFTFLEPSSMTYPLNYTLKRPPEEKQVKALLQQPSNSLKKTPNIYLFVIESFRDDFITPEVTPSLYAFKQKTISSKLPLANGNGSHIGWFSIFHSQLPYLWNYVKRQDWQMGAPTLQLLKKWGYQMRVYTSAQLGYYGMEELIFGKERHLVDAFHPFLHPPPLPAWQSDEKAMKALSHDLLNPELHQAQCNIIFLDSTHFNYSWPESSSHFLPVANEFSYIQMFYSSKSLEGIKNRYRNALSYVDQLFEKFLKTVPNKEEAIIIVTGDHGEEFFELGNLFHGSHLTWPQTAIPLYFQLGKTPEKVFETPISQMDIFPSIFDYLKQLNPHLSIPPCFEGSSVLSNQRRPFTILARFNAGRDPYEIGIHNGKYKLITRLDPPCFSSKKLYIRSLSTALDEKVFPCMPQNAWIEAEFQEALDYLFDSD